jgi:hypothetical protein
VPFWPSARSTSRSRALTEQGHNPDGCHSLPIAMQSAGRRPLEISVTIEPEQIPVAELTGARPPPRTAAAPEHFLAGRSTANVRSMAARRCRGR